MLEIERHSRPPLVFTDEEVAEAEARLRELEKRKVKLAAMKAKEEVRIAQLERPTVDLSNPVERVVYYISNHGNDETEFISRFLIGLYTKFWSDAEWEVVIKDTVTLLCDELGNKPLAQRLFQYAAQYANFTQAKKDKLFVESSGQQLVQLPKDDVVNSNSI